MTCEFLSCLSWSVCLVSSRLVSSPLLSSPLLSFLDVITQQGTHCVKVDPAGGSTKEQGHIHPQRPQQTDDLHLMQAVHMRKSKSVLLALNLYFKRQLGIYKVNMCKISITDIRHSKFIQDISEIIYVHVNVHMVLRLLIPQSS